MRNIFRKFVVVSLTMLMLSWMALPVMASPTVTFALSETSFSPNGDGFRDVTTVWFNLSNSANVSVRILQGTTVVATLHNNAALVAGPHAFIWGGTTNLSSGPVLPDGRYTMLIQANDGAGTGEVSGDFYILSHLITAGMIENGAITRDKLAFGAIDGARIADHSIGMDQLATITVLSGNIGDGSVTEPKLAANAVTTPKIADGAVTGAKIANGTVGQTQINSVGLDADTLDGKHAAAFDSADASETAARIAADAADATAWANADTADATAWAAADSSETAARIAADLADDATYVNDNVNEVDNADIADGSLAAAKIFGTAWTANNDGSGTGLNADLLDGLNSTAFQAAGSYIVNNTNQVDNADIADGSLAAAKIFGTAWTTLNDGSGSGLDADLLDGYHATFFTSSTQHTNDINALQSALTTETTNRQNADADRLNSSALGSNMRIESGETTISVGSIATQGPVVRSFGTPFIGPPIVLTNITSLGSDYAGTSVKDLMAWSTTSTISIVLKVTDNTVGTYATIRWIAIGN